MKNGEIESLAVLIVREQDEAGMPLSPVALEARKKLLAEWMIHRLEIQSDREIFKNDVIFCRNKLRELVQLDQHLDGEDIRFRAKIARYLDGIEHGRKISASRKVKESGEALTKAINSLKLATRLTDSSTAAPLRTPDPERGANVPMPDENPAIPSLTKDEELLIESELERARLRLQQTPPGQAD